MRRLFWTLWYRYSQFKKSQCFADFTTWAGVAARTHFEVMILALIIFRWTKEALGSRYIHTHSAPRCASWWCQPVLAESEQESALFTAGLMLHARVVPTGHGKVAGAASFGGCHKGSQWRSLNVKHRGWWKHSRQALPLSTPLRPGKAPLSPQLFLLNTAALHQA